MDSPWFWLLFLFCLAVYYWQATVTVIVVCLIVVAIRRARARAAAERAEEDARIAGLVKRADKQHRLVQQGRLDGVYGSYPVPKECKGMGIWLAD